MFYKFKTLFIRLLSVLILFYVLWIIVNKVSPTVNPPETRKVEIKRDYHGAIDLNFKHNELDTSGSD